MGTLDVDLGMGAEREAFSAGTFFSAIHGLSSPPEDAYLEVLPGARLGIFHRLVGSLLREPIEGLPEPVVTSRVDADLSGEFPELASDGLGDVSPRSLPGNPRSVAAVAFPNEGAVLVVPLAGVHGFDRFDPVGSSELHTSEGVRRVSHPLDLTGLLEREGVTRDDEQLERFEAELAESVANLALARLAARVLGRRIAGAAHTGETLVEAAFDGTLPGPDPTTFLERLAAIEERPTNPSAKIRRGMSMPESFVYAPEFTDRIDLRFVALPRRSVLQASARDDPPITDHLFSLFDGLEAAVRRSLPSGADLADRVVLPVHPWQFHHTLSSLEIEEEVVSVDGYTAPAAPLLNLRTVVPYPGSGDRNHRPHLKLPIDVQKTSSVRTIPPTEVRDGPRVTDALREIERLEAFEALGFLYEPTAACYRSPGAASDDDPLAGANGSLAALVRTNPHDHRFVHEDSLPVTAASLLATPPGHDRPLVCGIVDRFAAARGLADRDGAAAFFDAYLDVRLPDQLRLLGKYGIALDMHLQNVCLVFEDSVPTATLFRDFGGIRLLGDRLAAQDVPLDLAPGSPVEAGESMVYRNVVHSTLQTHVGELVRELVTHTALDESDCWAAVGRRYRSTFERLRGDGDVPGSWLARDESALFADAGLHNSRMAMRLQGIPRERAATEVSNPLAAYGPTARDRRGDRP